MLLVHRPRFTRGPSIETPVHAPVITTERLTLRPHTIADARRWYEIQSSSAVREFTSWPDRDELGSRRHLKDRTHHTVLRQADDFLALAVDREGELIGDVSLHLRSVSPLTRFVEISWILHPKFRGQGLATEAADAILRLAYEQVRARWVVAMIHPGNEASLALARRLAFRPIESTPGSVMLIATNPALAEQHAKRA